MKFFLSTKGFTDIIDITSNVAEIVKKSNIKEGICFLSCPGSTCAITTLEYESGAISDFKKFFEKIAPMSKDYEHCKKWGDCNGYAHIRSALLKPFLNILIQEQKLVLGNWQQIVFVDFDNKPRDREISVKIIKG